MRGLQGHKAQPERETALKDMILTINPQNPQGRLIQRAVDILAKGGLIIYPTDTQYGLGCDLTQKKAVERFTA
jgi:tRNA A37 threonylcarbamoyladenosine synthetase subunit TsaC/SUA5/YrdC